MQVQLCLLITKDLAASQGGGGEGPFELLMDKDKQARRDPCQKGDASWRGFRPWGKVGFSTKEPLVKLTGAGPAPRPAERQ